MKPGDWKQAVEVVRQTQQQRSAATTDSNQLSTFSLSELPIDQSRLPMLLMGAQAPLSTSTPICMQTANDQSADSTPA